MRRWKLLPLSATYITFVIFLCGCVERQLTITTVPAGALVILNDEEIGQSPVTVNFEWYGDYWVRLSKEGYETLNTHRELKGPWYDYFPFDFFAQIISPKRIVDNGCWEASSGTKETQKCRLKIIFIFIN